MDDALSSAGKLLSDSLFSHRRRIVFAESCTAGLVSATLARFPGVSEWHCGSAVTYRNATKYEWLGVPRELLEPPGPGPVSEPVAIAMAVGVLELTPEAEVAASVTGHLGPGAEIGLDGVVWIAVAQRASAAGHSSEILLAKKLMLDDSIDPGFTLRETRQRRAAVEVLEATAGVMGECVRQIDIE